MAVTIKSKKEIELMREAGKMLEEVHKLKQELRLESLSQMRKL